MGDSGKPLLPDSLSVSGSIDLSDTAITALPESLSVGQSLPQQHAIKAIPQGVKAGSLIYGSTG